MQQNLFTEQQNQYFLNDLYMVNKTVKREIFAANFRDRVVRHLIYNYISPIFEKTFIHDSYSCRKDKGTHYGIKRIEHFIRSCSQNYIKDSYILTLDIRQVYLDGATIPSPVSISRSFPISIT